MQVCHRNRLTAYSLRALDCAVCQLSALRSWTHCHNSLLTGFDPWRTCLAADGATRLLLPLVFSRRSHRQFLSMMDTIGVWNSSCVLTKNTPLLFGTPGGSNHLSGPAFLPELPILRQTFSTCPAVCSPKLHKHSGIAGRFILFVCVVQFSYFHPLLSLNNYLM